ncbi:N(2)-acetyl-L-2,4-diaminobutanoate deacetylase DoeB [uncultured Thiothrix sp.]|uniref:N(2)-acetyl-L-2,4-diaminobutanoate deacetylase DoeB n=1 Tax=uncultured Thiothrix sp. TaxID=223185 RepID=UPI00261D29C6|nr:N(2)-acetyl-L-2,4-diaminobutanoate deacetylase DoeB [uncultured Thiothrix sp.]
MSTIDHPIKSSIDFAKDGIQHGFLRLPYSRNDSAWGAILIPIVQFKHGQGSTALITGANHGDEYEGPIALYNFVQRTDLASFQGRVIIIPAMNYPAFQAGTRVSPLDHLNMNRIFPGKVDGSVTQVLADYFSRILLPLADYVLDIHSGGKTLDFLPFATCHELENKPQQVECEAAMQAFGAPYTLKLLEDTRGMYDHQAESMGKIFVSTELGGGGTAHPHSIAIAKQGIENFLIHAGILKQADSIQATTSQHLVMDQYSYVFSEHQGLLEPCVTLGEIVEVAQLIARIHSIERTDQKPHAYYAPRSGIIMARHVPSLIKMGDCLQVIAGLEH